MDKYAIEFEFEVCNDGKIDFHNPKIVSEVHWLYDSFEFEYDYWDWFKEKDLNPEWKDWDVGYYHVFEYGTVSEEWSENWEYGREFDGFLFEPEYTKITLIPV